MEMFERRGRQTKKLMGFWVRNRMPNAQIWGTATSYQDSRYAPWWINNSWRRIRLCAMIVHSQRAWCKGRSDRTPLEGVSYYSIGGHNVTNAVGMGRLCEFIEGSVCAVGE
jgi:hypothetical protein